MSLKIDKDTIYVIVPSTSEAHSQMQFMEKDFTVFIRAKIFGEELPLDTDCFLFSRNGKHSGICVRKNDDKLVISFSYWFLDSDETVYKNIVYELPTELENEFNDYVIKCNHKNQTIEYYVNKLLVGKISYDNLTKEDYSKSFIWFGCGSMIVDELYRAIGSFEYDTAFALSKNISIDDIYELKNDSINNCKLLFNELPVFNENTSYIKNVIFFLDFNNKSNYKLWNYSFNGIFPQLYIENNIYF
jgi:hypothetical protein